MPPKVHLKGVLYAFLKCNILLILPMTIGNPAIYFWFISEESTLRSTGCCLKGTSQEDHWPKGWGSDSRTESSLSLLFFPLTSRFVLWCCMSPSQFYLDAWQSRLSCDWFPKYWYSLCSKLELPFPARNCSPYTLPLSIEMLGSHLQLLHLFRKCSNFIKITWRNLTNMHIPGTHTHSV